MRAMIYRWIQKFRPKIYNTRSYGQHQSWRDVRWHVDKSDGRADKFRLAAQQSANAVKAFMPQANEAMGYYSINTDNTSAVKWC